MSNVDAMIDLETLATVNDAIVASIGVVLMDMDTKQVRDERLHMTLNWHDQLHRGRLLDLGTVRWWLGQSKPAQDSILVAPTMTNEGALNALTEFLQGVDGVWGNGADFDCVIMQSLYKTYGIRCPWSYSKHRCFRTVKNLTRVPAPERMGAHHNALDDAVHQAEWLMKALRVGVP